MTNDQCTNNDQFPIPKLESVIGNWDFLGHCELVISPSTISTVKKYLTETLGTFLLVFLGTCAIAKFSGNTLLISAVFAVALFLIYLIFARVSGAHINPAVSVGAWIAGKLSTHDIPAYLIAQFLGAVGASGAVLMVVETGPIGETVFQTSTSTAFIFEAVCTFALVITYILTAERIQSIFMRAFTIGALYFVIHFALLSLTGAGVNPARSVAPVVISANPMAAKQIWVYIMGPFVGAGIAGITLRWLKKGK